MTREEKKTYLLRNVNALLQKKPFFRGSDTCSTNDYSDGQSAAITDTRTARLPNVKRISFRRKSF